MTSQAPHQARIWNMVGEIVDGDWGFACYKLMKRHILCKKAKVSCDGSYFSESQGLSATFEGLENGVRLRRCW